ncbi:MAG: hypothetical protein GY757_22185, partial [bacterium]|nr:hypothetical protein [bacterium]
PRWVTEAVYTIINSKNLADNKGGLKIESLKEILDIKKYPPHKYNYIIELMKKFHLCYSVKGGTVLIPDLLDVAEPEFAFDYDNALSYFLIYDFLPKSVMARFIVTRNKEIKNNLRWRTGVVLENKAFKSTAVVKVDERDKKILIDVAGEQKRDMFTVLRHTFHEINAGFEKLAVKEMVPLTPDKSAAVPYDELTGYEQMGRDEYVAGVLKKTFSIKQLLNGVVSEAERQLEYRKEFMKLPKTDGDIYMKFEQKQLALQKQENKQEVTQKLDVDVDVKQEVNVDIAIDIEVELPAIQENFEELKYLLLAKDPGLKYRLKEIGDCWDKIHPGGKKEALTEPMTKLGRFLKKLGDENSDYRKLISGAGKGLQYAQKLGKAYNNVAQWLALPQIPGVLLKSKVIEWSAIIHLPPAAPPRWVGQPLRGLFGGVARVSSEGQGQAALGTTLVGQFTKCAVISFFPARFLIFIIVKEPEKLKSYCRM